MAPTIEKGVTMNLELAVSRAVLRARLAETALHSDEGWTISAGDVTVRANRAILDDRVVFSALISEPVTDGLQILSHNGVAMSVRPFSAPDFCPMIVDWEIVVAEESIAV
jgi:hypothetical protein